MSPATRTRLFAVAVVLIVIPIGLFARSHRADADAATFIGFLATYTGDTLWPIMFYFAARFCLPSARVVTLLVFVLVLTLTIEYSQLFNPPLLVYLRQQPGIGFLLGNCFIWSDVVCCVIGSVIATLGDLAWSRFNLSVVAKNAR